MFWVALQRKKGTFFLTCEDHFGSDDLASFDPLPLGTCDIESGNKWPFLETPYNFQNFLVAS